MSTTDTSHRHTTWRYQKQHTDERVVWRRVCNSNFYTQRQLCKCIRLLLFHCWSHTFAPIEFANNVWVGGRAVEHVCCVLLPLHSIFFVCLFPSPPLLLLLEIFFSSSFFARVKTLLSDASFFNLLPAILPAASTTLNSGYVFLCAPLCGCACVCVCVFVGFNSCLLLESFKSFCWCCSAIWSCLVSFHDDTKEEEEAKNTALNTILVRRFLLSVSRSIALALSPFL